MWSYSTSKLHLHNGSVNLQNIAWIYVHGDYWDQDRVSLEAWFLANYEI